MTLRQIDRRDLLQVGCSSFLGLTLPALLKAADRQRQGKSVILVFQTGGGSQLKHIGQLVEFHTGIECRIGYPNEHIASTSPIDVSSPMYATGVGLVMKFLEEENGDELSTIPKGETSNAGLGVFFKKMLDKIDKYLTNDE